VSPELCDRRSMNAHDFRRIAMAMPVVFVPVSGGWGQRGSTNVRLAAADETTIQSAVAMAWQNKAPKQLVNKQNKRRTQ